MEAAGGSLIDAGGDGDRLASDLGDSKTRRLEASLPLPPSGTRSLGIAYRSGVVGSEDVGEGRERFGFLCVGSSSRSGVAGVSEVSISG